MKKKRSNTSGIVLASAIAALPLVGAPALSAQRPPVEKPLREALPGGIRPTVVVLKFSERLSKQREQLSVIGLDEGHTIYQNARGEVFYLEPATGDMKFLSSDVFFKFTENPQRGRSGLAPRMWKWSANKIGGTVTLLGIDEAGHVVQQNARGERFFLDPATGDMMFVP